MAAADGKEVLLDLPFITLFKDGSVSRNQLLPLLPPSPADPTSDGVASKDVSLNADLGLWARLFLPFPPPKHALPVVLYFHGGGFMFGSPAAAACHLFCTKLSKLSESIVVSASYRLAPEHRIPACVDDAFSALQWLQSQALLRLRGGEELDGVDPWLLHADFCRCFVAGESAGGVIAHLVATKALSGPMASASWQPLLIAGLILVHPGFVRSTRSQEELDCHQDERMNWDMADKCLGLVLPAGSSDHGDLYLNPLPAINSSDFCSSLPRMLVALADNDAAHFLGLEYVHALKRAGCHVELVMAHGVGHVFFIDQPDSEQAQAMMQSIVSFINQEAIAL